MNRGFSGYQIDTDDVRLQRAHKFMNLPPRQWETALSTYSNTEQKEIAEDLEGIAEQAALVAGYVGARSMNQNHKAGVKRANRLCTAIRKAIGFSYPKYDLSF